MPIQTKIASILYKVKRQRFSFKRTLPTPEELKEYMRQNDVLNLEELKILQDKIVKYMKEAESSWFQSILSIFCYYVKGKIKLDVETLYDIMANFDKLAIFMPNEFWCKVILIIDKIGENLQKG